VSTGNVGDLQTIIKGDNAVYSKSNPGVTIAYTIRYLKDNEISKMGYTTDYSVKECTRALVPGARISIVNKAGYVAWGEVSYTDTYGLRRSASTGNFSLVQVGRINLPAGAHNITLDVGYRSVFYWFDLFTDKFDVPTKKCYKVWCTLFDRRYSTITCN